MEDEIKNKIAEFKKELSETATLMGLEQLRVRFLGRKGVIANYFQQLANLEPEKKPMIGKLLNEVKQRIQQQLKEKQQLLQDLKEKTPGAVLDLSLPGLSYPLGRKHILTQVIEEISGIFFYLGFKVVEGPEIETEYYNFAALNIGPHHPAHDTFHTFYLDDKYLLRSQTSTVQIRVMEKEQPPLRIISPGKVYRPEATDASHSFMFHQIEGFAVDEGVRFSDLKGTLYAFIHKLFGKDIKMRFRPHYFPFTEPSVEVDISCIICKGRGCRVCSHKGWLEILGAGMIHPNVFRAVGYDTKKFTGFAFGMGVERIAMLRYGIDDIRIFFENDLRFLRQF